MELADLKAEMERQFAEVGKRFDEADKRFTASDERFTSIDRRFTVIDQRFNAIDQRFTAIDERFNEVDQRFADLSRQIADEGEKTRRHMDVAVEQMKAERNLVLDQSRALSQRLVELSASNTTAHGIFEKRLDNHEHRISEIER